MSMQQTIAETRQVFAEIVSLLANNDDAALQRAPEGKWHCAQQVQHLVISQKMTTVAYKVPGFIVGLLYGKRANATSRSYEEIRDAYQGYLNQGAKAPAEYEPKISGAFNKDRLSSTFAQVGDIYLKALATKTDKELDTLQVKHPILGKLTLRELAYFTLYHNRHHLKSMQTLLA